MVSAVVAGEAVVDVSTSNDVVAGGSEASEVAVELSDEAQPDITKNAAITAIAFFAIPNMSQVPSGCHLARGRSSLLGSVANCQKCRDMRRIHVRCHD